MQGRRYASVISVGVYFEGDGGRADINRIHSHV